MIEQFRFKARCESDNEWSEWMNRYQDGVDQQEFPDDDEILEHQHRIVRHHEDGEYEVVSGVGLEANFRKILSGETRITDPKTGGQKGDKPEHMGDLDPEAMLVLAAVAGIGAAKYSPHNFLKGYAWSLSFNAMMRHAFAFWAGEDLDPETGKPHPAHAAWHGLALTSFLLRGIGTDDRPPRRIL